jgi:hypothetical protein
MSNSKVYPLQAAGTTIWSRDAKARGVTTGVHKHCPMEGCTGIRIGVRWKDKKITWPCAKGMFPYKNGWRIQ